MKIRNGFVSNSSSSSFVIQNKKMTTAQAASIMLYGVRKSRMEYMAESKEQNNTFYTCMDNAIRWLEENQTYDKPIVFPWTTNYETFIWRSKKGLCVSTCNNQQEYWDMLGECYYTEDYELPSTSKEFLDLDSLETFTEQEYRDCRWQKISEAIQKTSSKR